MTRKLFLPKTAIAVLQQLEAAGFESALVGGAVRDTLLGRPIVDIDIATAALPETVLRIFPSTRPTGLKHGTVTIVLEPGSPVEVTTFRRDGDYLDGRRPQTVQFTTSLHEDLGRRDFTMNAMAMKLGGELVDPFGGEADLLARRLRTVGEPADRFREDGLRLFRALRFASLYDLAIDTRTQAALSGESSRISGVSIERVGQELLKLSRGHWLPLVPIMAELDLFSYVEHPVPRLPYAFRRLAHQIDCTAQVVSPLPQDLEAMATWCVHEPQGPELVHSLGLTLALGKPFAQVAERVCRLAGQLLEHPRGLSPLMTYGEGPATVFSALRVAKFLAPQTAAAQMETWSQTLHAQPLWTRKQLAVTGRDLIARGFAGPQIGEVLDNLCRRVLDGELVNHRSCLLDALERLMKGVDPGVDPRP